MLNNMFLLTIFVISDKANISLPEKEQTIHDKIVPTILNFSEVFNITNSTIDFTSTTIEPTLYANLTEEEFELESDNNSTPNINPENSSVKSKKTPTKGYLSQDSYSDTKSIVLVVAGSVLFAAGLILAITNSYRRRRGYKILNSNYTNTRKSYGGVDHN